MYKLDIFITKNTNTNGILFFNFVSVSNFDCKFYVPKIKMFSKIFVSFYSSCWVIFIWLKSIWTICYHQFFLILINPFLGWSNSFGKFMELLPAKGLYFEILLLCSMTESVIQPETFPKSFFYVSYNCSMHLLI